MVAEVAEEEKDIKIYLYTEFITLATRVHRLA